MSRNRHIIIGTAGHVDHGKTELVKALTGINTDRLREEQARGISIELGFADLQLPSGDRVGLVDVPGHERFVKAMVAGAAGMDLGLLIVAADESVMPQTREHLDIMQMLGMRAGLVVLTKCDLVDEESLEIVDAELDDVLTRTFLENAPRVRTSARTGQGLDALRQALETLTAEVPPRPTDRFFRMPIDRAFALQGVGLVVTGTAWSGRIREGESLELLPPQKPGRVRGLQVHGEKRQEAFAGERVAINIHGFKQGDVQRGMLLATPGVLHPTWMIDARLQLLPSCPRSLQNRSRVRLHHGAAEVFARVVLLDRDALDPGDSAPVQLRLEEPLCAERGDRIVVRFYSPMVTLGGAEVVDPHPKKHKRFRDTVLQEMSLKETGGPADLILDAVQRAAVRGVTLQDLQTTRLVAAEELDAVLDGLRDVSRLETIGGRIYAVECLEQARDEVCRLAQQYQQGNPLAWGIPRAELQERLGWSGSRADFTELLEALSRRGAAPQMHLRSDAVRVGSTGRDLSPEDSAALDAMEDALRAGRFAPPTAAELQQTLGIRERFAAYVSVLEEQGRVVRLNDSLLYHPEALQEIEARMRSFLSTHDAMKMGDFKDLTDISRKYAVPLLEYFDRRGVTRREGDVRRAGPQLQASAGGTA